MKYHKRIPVDEELYKEILQITKFGGLKTDTERLRVLVLMVKAIPNTAPVSAGASLSDIEALLEKKFEELKRY